MRKIFIPHTGGLVDYKGENSGLFTGAEFIPGGIVCNYSGQSDTTVWPDYDPNSGKSRIEITAIDGALFFDPANPTFAIAQVGKPLTITATNDGPDGVWSTPIMAPYGKVWATTRKDSAIDPTSMTITLTPDRAGMWQATQDEINRLLPPELQYLFDGLELQVNL